MDTAFVRARGWVLGADEHAPSRGSSARGENGEWTPPATREELEAAILALSNDVGLILAQLAEDDVAWCQRTGRTLGDYGAWRRRALFAKVHKERQLRECKLARAHLTGRQVVGSVGRPQPVHRELAQLCRRALEVWAGPAPEGHRTELDSALIELADYLDFDPCALADADLTGHRSLEDVSADSARNQAS